MRVLIIVLVTIFSLVSCATVNDGLKSEKESRMTFDDWQSFIKKYEEINQLSTADLENWALENNKSALILSETEVQGFDQDKKNDMYILTNGLRAILNKNFDFQLGENIIHFFKGKFYVTDLDKYGNKVFNEKKSKLIGAATVEVINPDTHKNFGKEYFSRQVIELASLDLADDAGGGQQVARTVIDAYRDRRTGDYQREFQGFSYQPCNSDEAPRYVRAKLKYVHELVSRRYWVGPYNGGMEVYIDVKLEYNPKRRKWRAAGEYRNIEINVTGTVDNPWLGNKGPQRFNVNEKLSCVNRNTAFLIGWASFTTLAGPQRSQWIVNATGTITQEINGDSYGKKWTNYVRW